MTQITGARRLVASIVNSYSGRWGRATAEIGPEKYNLEANGAYGDHPTISYSPHYPNLPVLTIPTG
jgi:hypothetical protein